MTTTTDITAMVRFMDGARITDDADYVARCTTMREIVAEWVTSDVLNTAYARSVAVLDEWDIAHDIIATVTTRTRTVNRPARSVFRDAFAEYGMTDAFDAHRGTIDAM